MNRTGYTKINYTFMTREKETTIAETGGQRWTSDLHRLVKLSDGDWDR